MSVISVIGGYWLVGSTWTCLSRLLIQYCVCVSFSTARQELARCDRCASEKRTSRFTPAATNLLVFKVKGSVQCASFVNEAGILDVGSFLHWDVQYCDEEKLNSTQRHLASRKSLERTSFD